MQPAATEDAPAWYAVLGVKVSAVNMDTASEIVLRWVDRRERRFVTVTGVHGVIEAQDDPDFKAILNRSSLCVPDGVPLVWLCRAAGHARTGRVFGPDLMWTVSARLAERGGAAFYYGGGGGVADELAHEMAARFPGLRTAGTYCPPFRPLTPVEETEICTLIDRSGCDLVWVGLSTPKQEAWMAAMRDRLTVPVLIGVGAAFDYNTGRIRRAPRWMQKAALEWLYRLWQEPRRLWRRYLRNNPLFLWYLACERLGLKKFD